MKSHLFNGRNFSTGRSHLPRAFSSSIGFLADRAPPLRTTQTPLNPDPSGGVPFFFFSFFTRVERLKGGGGEKEESERGRDGSCPCFLIILKRSLERVSRLTFESRSSMEGVSANLFTVICSEGVEGYSLNGVVPRLGHSVMRAMISLFFDVRG